MRSTFMPAWAADECDVRQAGRLHQRKATDAACELRILHGVLTDAERMARLAGEAEGNAAKVGKSSKCGSEVAHASNPNATPEK